MAMFLRLYHGFSSLPASPLGRLNSSPESTNFDLFSRRASLSSGLGSLFRGESPGSLLGDPTLEARFDVMAPSRDEGNAALPMPLRQLLVTSGFRGILEVRSGGLVVSLFDLRSFDAASLDRALPYIEQLYRAASAS